MDGKYYLITDLGYDGMSVSEIDNEEEAFKEYKDVAKVTGKKAQFTIYEGIALIKGTLIKSKDIEFR
jgi:hypothetical protein